MLPCQATCPRYEENCHKTCAEWKQAMHENQVEREKKKKYLAFYSERCDTVIRQCMRMTPHYGYR